MPSSCRRLEHTRPAVELTPCYLQVMDPQRLAGHEAGAYRLLREVILDLREVVRALAMIDAVAPNPERARHLVILRAALAQFEALVQPLAH